jgi:hypothetical protein
MDPMSYARNFATFFAEPPRIVKGYEFSGPRMKMGSVEDWVPGLILPKASPMSGYGLGDHGAWV